MTAREWLERTFPVSGDRFQPNGWRDFEIYRPSGVDPSRMPTGPVDADVDDFIAYFGNAIESALSSGGSIYAALTDGTVQDRGWRPYFELWRAKGIIN